MLQPKRYLVVLFKVLSPKTIQRSKELQIFAQSEHLRRVSEIVNDPHIAQTLCSPFSKNQENHFQGIYNTGNGLIQSLFQLRQAMHPDTLQFSIGIGGVDNPINPVMATDIQGTAMEQAQIGLNRAPKTGHYLALSGFSKSLERTLLPSVALLWASTRSWNLNRLIILNKRLQGYSESAIGEQLQISERAVYKNIAQAQLGQWVDLILAVEGSFNRLLNPPALTQLA